MYSILCNCIFLQHSLWANKVDLSLSVGNRVDIQSNPLKVVDELDKLILADDSKEMWIQLSESLKVKDLVIGKLVEFCNYFVNKIIYICK